MQHQIHVSSDSNQTTDQHLLIVQQLAKSVFKHISQQNRTTLLYFKIVVDMNDIIQKETNFEPLTPSDLARIVMEIFTTRPPKLVLKACPVTRNTWGWVEKGRDGLKDTIFLRSGLAESIHRMRLERESVASKAGDLAISFHCCELIPEVTTYQVAAAKLGNRMDMLRSLQAIVIFHEATHSLTNAAFGRLWYTPSGVGPDDKNSPGCGESGWGVELRLMGGQVQAVWKKDEDWNFDKILRLEILMANGNRYKICTYHLRSVSASHSRTLSCSSSGLHTKVLTLSARHETHHPLHQYTRRC